MQNRSGIGIPVIPRDGRKPIYKVNEIEEKKAFAKKEAMGMVENGIEKVKTVRYLVEAGYSLQDAGYIVANLEIAKEKVKQKKAQNRKFSGASWVAIGTLVAIGSYYMANDIGFVPAGLAILFGAIQCLKGWRSV